MEATLELTIKLTPEELEGGYTRYISDDLPGFHVLCEPEENPIPILQDAITAFMPSMLRAAMKDKLTLKGLRIISTGKTLFKGSPDAIIMEADLAQT
jgi:hypothetical protein